MKNKKRIQEAYRKFAIHRWIAFLLCATLVGGMVSTALPVLADNPRTLAAAQEEGLIAHFTFDNSSNRLNDSSGSGVTASLHEVENANPALGDPITDTSTYFNETGENANALHLDDNACLVLTETEAFKNLTDVTVEMRIKIAKRDLDNENDPNQNWLFYTTPTGDSANFLGAFINPKINIARTNNNGGDKGIGNTDFLNEAGSYQYDKWYTVRAIYKPGAMALYVDGKRMIEVAAPNNKTSDYFGVDKTLWFGHSAWPDTNFNGYIDDIKIYNYLNYDGLDVYLDDDKYIVKDNVADPANTTVNMFDYWITEQTANDFNPPLSLDDVRDGGINKDHLLLFAGVNASDIPSSAPNTTQSSRNVGSWNSYVYNENGNHHEYEPFQGIVNNVLNNGYPQLAIEELKDSGMFYKDVDQTWYTGKDPKESLAYLFDPDPKFDSNDNGVNNIRAVYTDVTGLFRLDDKGYYYFSSGETFAELNKEQRYRPKESAEDGNKITLYKQQMNQFYPFNDWSDLAYIGEDGNWVQLNKPEELNNTDEPVNHYFGMTVTTDFQQAPSGELDRGAAGLEPMKFEFSGDDDVWIFIDDVLVGDVGGIHQTVGVEIDFSTGEIKYTGNEDIQKFNSTLYKMFENAHRENTIEWKDVNGNKLFPDGSVHALKFFYLERGNAQSHCFINFNMMEPPMDYIRKTDENGDPLEGAKFELYRAQKNTPGSIGSDEWWHTADEFQEEGEPLTVAISGKNGYAELTDDTGSIIDFAKGGEFYILKETGTPAGYRTNPDIVLQYHSETGTFIVVNKYETGAYASFVSHWTYYGDAHYADYKPMDGVFTSDGGISTGDLENGLAIMVPIYRQTDANGFVRWVPVYGSNTNGWHVIADNSYQDEDKSTNTKEQFVKDVALAAILQIADTDERTPDWYLNYVKGAGYLDAYMENLPADATRYVINGKVDSGSNKDLCLVTLLLPAEVLSSWGLAGNYGSDYERYQALQKALSGINTEEDAKNFLNGNYNQSGINGSDTLGLLYNGDFTRSNRSVIYIPNEQRELRVRKTGPNGEYVNGAVFAIFDTWQDAANYKATAATAAGVMDELSRSAALSYGITSTVALRTSLETQDEKGMLIFREDASAGEGYAQISWPSARTNTDSVLWMKEVFAPEGYALNENLIRIEVGNMAIYANATGYGSDGNILKEGTDDGITVDAYLGKLSQTLVKYALGNNVEVTLQDITITKQTAAEVGENGELDAAAKSWEDATSGTPISYDLHYGMNTHALTGQYGQHYASDPLPVFTAGDGYIRVMPRQNQIDYSNTDLAGYHDPGVRKVSLIDQERNPIDLGNLFVLMNEVVVEDKPTEERPPEEQPPEEQPPEKKRPKKKPSEKKPPEEKPPEEQPPEDGQPEKVEETRITGVMTSPKTGDSSMVGLWFTLLVLSITGITELTKVYCVRKREGKEQ